MAQHSFYLPPFVKRGGYEANINSQVYSFHVIFITETMRLSFTLSFVLIYQAYNTCQKRRPPPRIPIR